LKCQFKSAHPHSYEESSSADFCYMTLTGHPLNDLQPLSIDQVPQIISKAIVAWVGYSIPLVVLSDLDSVKFCLVCHQNQDTDIFAQIKPDSRNRNIHILSNFSNINFKTVQRVSYSYKNLAKVAVTQSLATNAICVTLLSKNGRVLIFESDLRMNF